MARKGKRFKGHKHRPQPRPMTPVAEVLPTLDMGFLKASTVATKDWQFIQFILAGAGGTGSYLAQHLGRIMHSLYRMQKGVHMTIVDPDIIAEENVGRSLFCDAEIGMPKAEALARRYGHAWGLNVSSYVGQFHENLLINQDLTIIVGAVDNAKARQTVNELLSHNPDQPDTDDRPSFWWLDCGNVNNSGRVLLGSAHSAASMLGAFSEPGRCISLPSPALQYPGLLEAQPEELGDAGDVMTCAQRAAANLQSLNINAALAVEASDFLTRLLITHDLKRFACEVNLASGSVRSTYVTVEEVARASRKPVGFMTRKPEGSPFSEIEREEMTDFQLEELLAGVEA